MTYDVIVVGSGVGGLVAAIELRARGRLSVCVLEAAEQLGGKAAVAVSDGVEFDTGPSVLTLPEFFDDVFSSAGASFREEVTLLRPSPAFRYYFANDGELDVFHELEDTLSSVRSTFGSSAELELAAYLREARRIWEAAEPHFVRSPAPELGRLLLGGVGRLLAVSQIDAMRTLQRAIEATVKTPELRMLLQRYATYNGSDARTAPATLGCIAHVELSLGGYGVQGGMYELIRALVRLAQRLGVEFRLESTVEGILVDKGCVSGVRLRKGTDIHAAQVVANGDVAQLNNQLLPAVFRKAVAPNGAPSMSAYNAVYRSPRKRPRAAHAVVFPSDYLQEFADIFDRKVVPRDPTVYVCAQEVAHGRVGWGNDEPLFAMANAPSWAGLGDGASDLHEKMTERLSMRDIISAGAEAVWSRSPRDLAQRFPGSDGSLYGPASNDKWAAFRRSPNAIKKVPGLFVASGSAHPGGGLPMVAQSGRHAAFAALHARGLV